MNTMPNEYYQSLDEYNSLFRFRPLTEDEIRIAEKTTRKGMRDGETPHTWYRTDWESARMMVSVDERWEKDTSDPAYSEYYPLVPQFVTVCIVVNRPETILTSSRQIITIGAAKRMEEDQWNLDRGIKLAMQRALTTSISVSEDLGVLEVEVGSHLYISGGGNGYG